MIDGAKLKRDILNDMRVDLANTQYINGAINYLDLLDAQRSYLNSQMQYSTAVVQEYKALVSLYKALGGGWQDPVAPAPDPEAAVLSTPDVAASSDNSATIEE